MRNVSIVIATYTGEKYLSQCLQSILDQPRIDTVTQLVLVIDGPNETIKSIAESYIRQFEAKGVDYIVKQLERNQGRFEARLVGAKLATSDELLFIDDRTLLRADYLENVQKIPAEAKAFVSTIKEASHPNIVSKSLFYVRKAIYKNWGTDFTPYYITGDNFEKEAKGAAGLLVGRKLFIAACREFKEQTKDTENSSDDTKLLRIIVEATPLYKTSDLVLFYEPRPELSRELRHIYERGPKFIDYYLRPGARYFYPLIAFLVLVLALVIVAVVNWRLVLVLGGLALVALVIFAVYVTRSLRTVPAIVGGLVLTVVWFGIGLVKGIIMKAVKG